MFGFRYLKDVVTLELARERCIGCGMCVVVCPHRIFSLDGGKASVDDRDSCMECGACARNCPADAISVDAGVGCAWAVFNGFLRRKEPTCGCETDPTSCCN